ncbi:hypothetical protein NDU88_001956 [Pleurodeles waltl]|uniref:Uncharacterized protein n=1 Tax=Pleurodeles waltl TaxID=8319 RepID=A0AAV7LB00_PLEWA|nr:hypothetical protein NDU88_001956 [Pleurodeles waltl]
MSRPESVYCRLQHLTNSKTAGRMDLLAEGTLKNVSSDGCPCRRAAAGITAVIMACSSPCKTLRREGMRPGVERGSPPVECGHAA